MKKKRLCLVLGVLIVGAVLLSPLISITAAKIVARFGYLDVSRDLGGGFFVFDDPDHRHLIKEGGGDKGIVIHEHIVDFKRVGGYVIFLRKVAQSYDCEGHGGMSIITHQTDRNEYWIVSVNDANAIWGPLTKQGFDDKLAKLEIKPWFPLKDDGHFHSNDDYFKERAAECKSLMPIL